ncbi:hypothetical protein O0Q50_19295 [Priestia aryabhattai]|uniref:DUF465 domain-containing protein n=1 Tax=Priestia aryabhattai TaxID=412384 RepID=A0AAX6NCB8_PRIAR|nr:hypothetical protein [Priestia aryabhattai]MDU9693320.1 hypothetical protein [Priestia aryabhattai]
MKNSTQPYLTSAKLVEAEIAYFEQKVEAKNIQPEQLELLNKKKEQLKKLNEQINKTS